MYAGPIGIETMFSETKKDCPVCGYEDRTFTVGCTSTVTVSTRRTSIQEIQCYQKLYGDLVTHVDHYKEIT